MAWNASFCSSISRFMSSVRMPISCPLPVSISAHGIASRPRWLGIIEAHRRAIDGTEELAGARPADVGQRGDEGWHVLADPEGNEFCLLRRQLET